MRLDPTAPCSVFTAQMPHGQGHETTFAQIAADELGVPFEQVRVVVGDTDTAPIGLRHRRQPRGDDGRRRHAPHGPRAAASGSSTCRPTCSRPAPATSSSSTGKVAVRGVPVSAISAGRRSPSRRPATTLSRRRRRSTAARAAGRAARTARSSRSTSRPGHVDDRALRRRRGLRCAHQPGHRRGPGARRRRPGHRRRAARAVGVRRGRAVPRGHVHGLPAADGDRDPADRDPPPRDRAARSRRELPGRRRGRDDRVAAHARATPSRTRSRRSA